MPDLVLPIRNLRLIRSLEYDYMDNKIYWSMDSGKYKMVMRSSVNGTNVRYYSTALLRVILNLNLERWRQTTKSPVRNAHVHNIMRSLTL